MSNKESLPVPVAPARGARAGVKSDVDRVKAGAYNPAGTGTAWSHNFLNQKPWHPLNFRNQVKKYEAEMKAVSDAKERERALAEWQSEQEKDATLAFLNPDEAKRQRDRAQISFMYAKPPGLEAALARDREVAEKKAQQAAAAAAADGPSSSQQQQQQPPEKLPAGQQQQQLQQRQQQAQQQEEALRQRQMALDRLREDPFAAILAARSALQSSEKFVLKSVEGVHGGVAPSAANQLLLGDGEEEQEVAAAGGGNTAELDEAEVLLASLDPEERQAVLAALAKKRRKAEKAARLEQAQELLRSAGIDLGQLAEAEGEGGSSRHKRHHGSSSSKHKRKHKHKHKSSKRLKKESKSHRHERDGGQSSRRGGRKRTRSGSSGSSSDEGSSSSSSGG